MAHSIDSDLTYDARTLPEQWRRRAEALSDEDCIWFEGAWLSWSEIDRRSKGAAASLASAGLRQGERVCVLMQNSPDMIVALLAIWRRGLVAVPLSAQLVGPLLRGRLLSIEPAAVVADATRVADLAAASEGVDYQRFVGGQNVDDDHAFGVPAGSDQAEVDIDVAPSDVALILFTSGSTGVAKGCVMSHHYAIYYSWVFWRYMEYRRDDVLYTCLPLNHCHALFSSWWPGVLAGSRVALGKRFSASGYWREIAQSEATVCSAIGMMTQILLSNPPDVWESKSVVRVAHLAADDASRVPEFEQRFGLKAVSSRYGSTEAMVFPPLLAMPPAPGLIGPAPPDFEVAVVDSDGHDVGDGIGELLVRPRIAHTMFAGYYGMPEASLEVFDGLWFHTGDLVRRDAVGLYWFVGRANDTIRRRGENVSAWEIERSLSEHPAVEQVAALAIPSALNGEDIGVVVVPCRGVQLTAGSVEAFADKMLPRYMRPDRVWLRQERLPTTASDKVDKAPLRRQYLPTAPTLASVATSPMG